MDRGRLEAFSDGVFAVAITLLALDLALPGPGHDNGPLLRQVGTHWPSFVAYLISFFTIGIIWVNHHAVVTTIAMVDRTLLFLNLLLLFFVVLIPFGTATMAAYLTVGGQDAQVAMVMYGGIFQGMGLSFAAIFGWTLRAGRTHRSLPTAARRAAWLRFAVGNLGYAVAIVVALTPTSWSAPAALALIGLVAVYYIAERTPAARGPSDAPVP
jgi:uncharacterized membrane protein